MVFHCRYYTDNGACYYYNTGNYSNYEEVLDAVVADAKSRDIPFRYLQVSGRHLLVYLPAFLPSFYIAKFIIYVRVATSMLFTDLKREW